MPLQLAKLFAETTEEDMPYLGDTLHLTWTPAGYTPAVQDRIAAAADDNSRAQALLDLLASLVRAWDLLEEDGSPVPLTKERLALLPWSFLVDVTTFLTASISPKEASLPDSSDS